MSAGLPSGRQTRTLLSAEPETIRLPSSSTASAVTAAGVAIVPIGVPSANFHSRIDWSADAETSVSAPLNRTAVTGPVWPASVLADLPGGQIPQRDRALGIADRGPFSVGTDGQRSGRVLRQRPAGRRDIPLRGATASPRDTPPRPADRRRG